MGLLLAVALAAGGMACHQTGPEDPSPVSSPRLVSVAIEYEQPAACNAPAERCNDKVVVFGSWMRAGEEFELSAQPGHIHSGRALEVPVNFPPRGEPYELRVYDPHLLNNVAAGLTAERLTVGGEHLTHVEGEGGQFPRAYVYVDANGQGHNPY